MNVNGMEIERKYMISMPDAAFLESIHTGVKERNHIDHVLESAKLLDTLYASAEVKSEVTI